MPYRRTRKQAKVSCIQIKNTIQLMSSDYILFSCIQYTLSSRARLALASAFRLSARASKGILHTI